MKILSLRAIALAAIVFCSISANAQRQTKLYIDDGTGNFTILEVPHGSGGGTIMLPSGTGALVNLQSATPGTQQTGNINLTGSILGGGGSFSNSTAGGAVASITNSGTGGLSGGTGIAISLTGSGNSINGSSVRAGLTFSLSSGLDFADDIIGTNQLWFVSNSGFGDFASLETDDIECQSINGNSPFSLFSIKSSGAITGTQITLSGLSTDAVTATVAQGFAGSPTKDIFDVTNSSLSTTFFGVNKSGAIIANGSTGSSTYVLTSNGASGPATWQASSGGGGSFIQNQNSSAQTSANFFIAGAGTVGTTMNITTSTGGYQIGGNTVLANSGTSNLFMGQQAGSSNAGSDNTFSGFKAGFTNGSSGDNTFSGYQAGYYNTGSDNTFSGSSAGQNNSSGNSNTFAGFWAGFTNQGGGNNTFSGYQAGYKNLGGGNNTFVGYNAGYTNVSTGNNTALGYGADVSVDGLTNATAIGNGAIVNGSNTMQLGNTSVTNVKTSGAITAGGYSGGAVSGSSVTSTGALGTGSPNNGGLYSDNYIQAAGWVTSTGGINNQVGNWTVSHTGIGTYKITMGYSTTGNVPMMILTTYGIGNIATISGAGNTPQMYDVNIMYGPTGAQTNSDFNFIIVGPR